MTLNDLMTAFRARADDTAEPYLWSDNEVKLFLNDAESEAADRARLIQDSTTAAVCQITIAAGTARYPLHTAVLDVRRAKVSSGARPLTQTSIEELDMEWPDWESATGEPTCFYESEGDITLVPKPTQAGTLAMTVHRLPLEGMVLGSDAPEIASRHHFRLVDWALRCAFMKRDADTYDETKAGSYEAMFVASFGYRADANVQRKQRDKRPPIVKANW